ncbi:MAG: MarR family transcriptional regulator [Flavobacteriaceae bacterium]|jgi:DNA-binding MarR family transcriptional regulator|nr:MarR family transcriptional regulator [Flavobacteriaceae bacterium]MBT7458596.1 MarR family transcriptional regulator [Flavobacteriaceae bacterium]MDG0966872.1 MarR family transcriptional regulator [Flavobacteriaceae bacterium]
MRTKTIDHVLRATWQAVSKMYNEEASKYGASMATGLALLSIDTEEGVPSTSLGPRMGMEATSLSRTLKTMENQGLIRREPNPEDGRGVLIRLTKDGLEKRSMSKEVVKQFNRAITQTISPEELEAFYKVAEVILTKLHNKSIFVTPQIQL